MPLTVAILALNEADRIEGAVRSVAFAEEILVLDAGSSDGTVRAARAAGARVLETDWPGFVAQRNRALAEARHDRVFFLDADERVSPELAASLVGAEGPGFRVRRQNRYLGQVVRGRFGRDAPVRLVDRRRARCEGGAVHEQLVVEGPIETLQGWLVHDPYRSREEHLRIQERYARLFVEGALREGRRARWWDLAFRPTLHFVSAYLLRGGFLDGRLGLELAVSGARHVADKWRQLAEAA